MSKDHIKLTDSGTTYSGRSAVEVMRLATLLSGLRLQAATGLKLSRNVNPRAIAKAEFGLKTNSFDKLIAAAEAALAKARDAVPVINERKDEPREEPLLEHSFNA